MAEIFLGLTWLEAAATVFALCLAIFLGAVIGLNRGADHRKSQDFLLPPTLLFDRGLLRDANRPGYKFLAELDGDTTDWSAVRTHLSHRFTGLPKSLGVEVDHEYRNFESLSPNDDAFMIIDQWGDTARITIHESETESTVDYTVPKNVMQRALVSAPNPIWHTAPNGEVVWANAAYNKLAKQTGKNQTDITPVIFNNLTPQPDTGVSRTALADQNNSHSYWYDVTSIKEEGGQTHYAIDANAVVKAEVAQRNFVQTLTKTFAQLSIGLALFDRNRQLTLFNPALIDLTSLPADFLSSRPTLLTFFDRLRESRAMPEPKNYSSWREQIAELVVAAADDRYCETWALPSGVTYRVVGRPHPDGAIALLFEDISAEVSLTRRFRAELELSQSVFDALDLPIAVFSASGALSICNQPYQEFWDGQPNNSVGELSIDQALDLWQERCEPSAAWSAMRRRTRDLKNHGSHSFDLTLKTGEQVTLALSTVHGGSILAVFKVRKLSSKYSDTFEKIA